MREPVTQTTPHITVCVCTFKRPRLLRRTLEGIDQLQTGGLFTLSIVVADNDRLESARKVVLEFQRTTRVETVYCVEPEQNIALARNKAVSCASGEYIAFIDDDEFPQPDWLSSALKASAEWKCDGVLGLVNPVFDSEPPRWLVKGGFCSRQKYPTGMAMDWRQTCTANTLFKSKILDGIKEPFDPKFGNGGEDQMFFRSMMRLGCQFVWCNESVVFEVVPPERWTRRYLLKRALQRGQNERQVADARSITKSVIAAPIYAGLLPFAMLAGQHVFMNFLVKFVDHSGKLIAMLGWKPLGDKYLGG